MNSRITVLIYLGEKFMNHNDTPLGFKTMTSSIEFANNYNSWIVERAKPFISGNLLEVGTGQGNFKKIIQPYVKKYFSTDIDVEVIERAKNRDPKGNYFVADVSNKNDLMEFSNFFDTVIIINVLEHIEDDLKTINNLLSTIKKDGYLFIFVPAFNTLYNDLDKLAGHVKRYNKKDFFELNNKLNSEIVKIEYFNPVGGFGWFLNKFKRHNDLDSKEINNQMMYFDKYFLPISKVINVFTKKYFGQSLIVVFKK